MYYTMEVPASMHRDPSMRSDIPPGLERTVLLRGPAVLDEMIRTVGGVVSASRVMEVSVTTLTRWIQQAPSPDKCSRVSSGHRSIWPGYPSPFPGMDRVVERMHGPDASYLGALSSRFGSLSETMETIRRRGWVSLLSLDVNRKVLSGAISGCGAPSSSSRRWIDGVRYPRQLSSLDRLAQQVGHPSWFEAVLLTSAASLGHPVPAGALLCLVAEMLEDGVISKS